MATTPMLSPDGQSGDIPIAKVPDAVKAGFKVAAPMQAPDGSIGYIPQERVADAMKAGFVPHAVAQVMPPELKANLLVDTRVNAPGPFQQTSTASLPLKIASGVMGAMAPGSEAVDIAKDVLPSTERAGQAFQDLKSAIGENPVEITDKLGDALSQMKEGIDTGLNAPSVVNKLVTRLADTEEGPLTYSEARQFYSNMGDLATSEKMAANAKMQRLIYQVQHALGESIANTAESAGQLNQYKGAMSEFAKAKGLQEVGSNAVDVAKKAAIPALFGAGGMAAYNAYQKIFGQ